MSGHRRAAVALHGLQAFDRQAMLAELPIADQQILQGYLNELDALGFSNGPDLLQQLPPSMTAIPADGDSGEPAAVLRRASAAQLLDCLQEEPASLIARVLALDNWPWQEALLTQLAAPLRQRVRAQMQALPAAPRLQACLLATLAQKLAALPVRRVAPLASKRKPHWLAAWRQRWSR